MRGFNEFIVYKGRKLYNIIPKGIKLNLSDYNNNIIKTKRYNK